MCVFSSLLVLFVSLLLPGLDCFHVSPGQRVSLPSVSENGTIKRSFRSYTYDTSGMHTDAGEASLGTLHPLGAAATTQESSEETPDADTQGGELLPADESSVNTASSDVAQTDPLSAMYVLFRVFEAAKDTPEEELYGILQRFMSSLVHDSFFDVHVFRESEGGMPPLFLVNFNSFKAYDFVRSQLYARDPSARDLLDTFYFHISRHSPSPASYAVQVANYMTKRNAYQQMLRLLRRKRYANGNRMRRPRYYAPRQYDRTLSMQFTAPVPGSEPMFQPPPIQGIHIHPMMPPPQYIGPMGHSMPSHRVHHPMG